MQTRRRKIGILGGTFNPVHLGHLALARAAAHHFRLDEVWFVPCSHPPHKKAPNLASGRDRLAMLKLALQNEPRFRVKDIEIRRRGISYSVDTLRAFQKDNPDVDFYFVIGADMLPGLRTWRHIDELFKRCRFLVMQRPGTACNASLAKLPPSYRRELRKGFFTGPQLDISSSEVRRRVRQGLSIEHLVPDPIMRYIASRGLYRRKEKATSKRKNWRKSQEMP